VGGRKRGPHVCAIGEFEIEFLVADSSVVFVELEKLSFLEEEDCIPEILFDFPNQVSLVVRRLGLPVLFFKRGKCFPCTCGNMKSSWIIVFITWSVPFFVTDIL